jgi:putative nucleotidyltransferase with HDIG domain
MVATDTGLAAQLDRLIGRLPAVSPVALRLMALISNEDVPFKEVARLIGLDPTLAGEVLKLANSGFYGRRYAIHSIAHAIALVGIRRVTPIVITAAIWRALPRQPSPAVKTWWRHSIASALVAQHVCQGDQNSDSAYTAGLLHALGQLAFMEHAGEQYQEMMAQACATGDDLLERERQTFGADHAALAALILDRWNLPPSIRDAVGEHHAEPPSPVSMIRAVHTGCVAAEYIGFGTCGCHQRIAAEDIPPEVTKLIESRYLDEVLPQEVNGIECSLL